ncbi:MAG: hypothetical protein J6S60_04700 [Oscillospiraceae bacterium]|nr:hypothetical protein [Oscillospiraceae bacterium]
MDTKTKKPGWEYDEEDEEILGVGESEMPETAEEALKRARTMDGGTADQLTDPKNIEFLRGAAVIYELLMYTDFEPDEDAQVPLNMRQTIIQVRNRMRQEVLDAVLGYIDDMLQDMLEVEEAQRQKRGE